MERRLEEIVNIRLSKKMHAALKAEAEVKNITSSELVRSIIEEYLIDGSTKNSLPELEDALRKVVDRHVESIAGLCVHAGIAAGTSAWLVRSLLKKEYGAETTPEIWAQAVIRAKENLRRGTMEERKNEE